MPVGGAPSKGKSPAKKPAAKKAPKPAAKKTSTPIKEFYCLKERKKVIAPSYKKVAKKSEDGKRTTHMLQAKCPHASCGTNMSKIVGAEAYKTL